MFVEGCSNVLRMYKPNSDTFDEWDTDRIYKSLGIAKEEFGRLIKGENGQHLSHTQMYDAICTLQSR